LPIATRPYKWYNVKAEMIVPAAKYKILLTTLVSYTPTTYKYRGATETQKE
jgi:hypothetical protein